MTSNKNIKILNNKLKMQLKHKQQRKVLKNNEINQIKDKYLQEINQFKDKVQFMENKYQEAEKVLRSRDDEIKESKVMQLVLVKQIDKLNLEISQLKSANQLAKNDASNLQNEIKVKQTIIEEFQTQKTQHEQTIDDVTKRMQRQKEEMSNLEYENM